MSSNNNQNTKKFDLSVVYDKFTLCSKSDNLDLSAYILAYYQFNNFFAMMGTVFGFIASDVQSKLEVLEAFQRGDNKANFETIKQMIEYEKDQNLINNSKYVSGTRTLLRLHRALIFIALFLEDIFSVPMDQKLSGICQKAYNATLAKYHPWIIQKAALVAMYALPNKEGLLNRIKSPEETAEFYNDLLPKAVEAMKEVYNRTQKFYEENNFLDLP